MNRVLRIFLSSTAMDLIEHRKAVLDAILRLGDLPVAMEHFGAKPNEPVQVCLEYARESDCVLAIVAHRYGWVPLQDEGGDGTRSITELEVTAALEIGKPVFAFIADPDYPWRGLREQDLLLQATTDSEIAEVVRNVRALTSFKTFLGSKVGIVRESFTTPDELALRAAASLARWVKEQEFSADNPTMHRPKWSIREIHPLQPALHFRGREDVLEKLWCWWLDPAESNRVCSLVGMGGVGKTAIAERFVRMVRNSDLRGSVLVWSFYEDQDVDSLVQEACATFGESRDLGRSRGRLPSLQQGLAGEEQHLIVLDGLEQMQCEGGKDRAQGELTDPTLRNLLRSIGSGLGRTKCLTTSRFKLANLDQWEGKGRKTLRIQSLSPEAAVSVFRAWEVGGTDEMLVSLAERVGRHPLSVSVLGSFIHHYSERDPAGAESLDLAEFSAADPQAARLGRIVAGYVRALSRAEFRLLARLSAFARPVPLEYLQHVEDKSVSAGNDVSSPDDASLTKIARRLEEKGLLSSVKLRAQNQYTIHPFLRDHLRSYLQTDPRDIHEAVRSSIAPELELRPGQVRPSNSVTLQAYEDLISETVLAGRVTEAFELYAETLGRADHLGRALNEFSRGFRICAFFSQDGEPEHLLPELPPSTVPLILADWGYYALSMGNLSMADRCYSLATEAYELTMSRESMAISLRNNAESVMLQGRFSRARDLALRCVKLQRSNAGPQFGLLAMIDHIQGLVGDARAHFLLVPAAYVENPTIRIFELEHLLDLGRLEVVEFRASRLLRVFERMGDRRGATGCHYVLGMSSVARNVGKARSHLNSILDGVDSSKAMEDDLRGRLLAAEINLRAGDLVSAAHEAKLGLAEANNSGFGWMEIKLLLSLAKIQTLVPDATRAIQYAETAVEKSQDSECLYAWAEADALHMSGVGNLKAGNISVAKKRLKEAVTVRQHIGHPSVNATQSLLTEVAT